MTWGWWIFLVVVGAWALWPLFDKEWWDDPRTF
jgi:hypothetical protein